MLSRWKQFFSNLLNVNHITSHEGSEVYTGEPDIADPSLIEVELAIEKQIIFHRNYFKQVEIKYTKKYINSLYSFGTRKKCHKNGKNTLLFQFIRKAIELTVIIIEEFLSCLLHINFFRTYFYRE